MYLKLINNLVNGGYNDMLFDIDIDSLSIDIIKTIEQIELEYFENEIKR